MSKASKNRPCPAVGRSISSGECGSNRISRYACPESCPFNPFSPANYDQFSEIERGLIQKHSEWFVASSPNKAADLQTLQKFGRMDDLDAHGFQIAEMFFNPGPDGVTRMARWEAAGFPGMKNDEVVIQRALKGLQFRLLEVHRVLDDLRIEAVDLLESNPVPMTLCDRSLALQACRFTTILAWTFPLPHYTRLFGHCVMVTELPPFDALFIVRETARHLGCPDDPAQANRWFGLNFARLPGALGAVAAARRRLMFERVDGEFGKAVYELRAPFAECRAKLDAIAEVDDDPLAPGERDEGFAEARVWFASSNPDQETAETLGRVLLGQAHWRAESLGRERLAELRRRFESVMGDSVQFSGERRDNLAASLKAKEPDYDPALVSPRLLEHPPEIRLEARRFQIPISGSLEEATARFNQEHDREWIDAPVPALDNRTPRDAAREPALRSKLLPMLKQRVREFDEQSRETGNRPEKDINWMLEELGVQELIFDPPPFRTAHASGFADDLQLWPPPPAEPFTMQESHARLATALETFDGFDDAVEAMFDAGGFPLDDIRQFAGDVLDEQQFWVLDAALVRLWFAFVPPGFFGPDIPPEELLPLFERRLEELYEVGQGAKDPKAILDFLANGSSQRNLYLVIADSVVEHGNRLPNSGENSGNPGILTILVLLSAAIELLDKHCRED